MMSRHKEIMWGNPPIHVHQGSLQNTAANTGGLWKWLCCYEQKGITSMEVQEQ